MSDKIILQLNDNSMVALLSHGQRAMSPIIEQIFDKLDFEHTTKLGFARRWYPLGKNGLIVIDPQVSFGRPTVIGRSVATNNIYDFYLGEKQNSNSASQWLNIPPHEFRLQFISNTVYGHNILRRRKSRHGLGFGFTKFWS